MSDENQNEDAQVVDEPVDEVVPEPTPEPERKPKTAKYRVLFTSPFGRKGDEVDLPVADQRVKRLLKSGGLEKV